MIGPSQVIRTIHSWVDAKIPAPPTLAIRNIHNWVEAKLAPPPVEIHPDVLRRLDLIRLETLEAIRETVQSGHTSVLIH